MNETRENVEIDVLSLVLAVLKRWWVVAIASVVCATGMYAYTKLNVKPTYQSSTLLYVNNSSISVSGTSLSLSSSEFSSAKSLVETYFVIMKSRLTLEDVIKEADLKLSYSELVNMISGASESDTAIFRVTVTDTDPERACKIANTIAAVLPTKIQEIIRGSSCAVVDMAVVPTYRSGPSYSKKAILGAAIGALLSAAVLALQAFFDDTISSEDWFQQTFGDSIPVLAAIPDASDNDVGGYASRYSRYSKKYSYYRSYYGSGVEKPQGDSSADEKRE